MAIDEVEVNGDLLLEHAVQRLAEIVEFKSRYRRIVQAAIAGWVKGFQAGHIQVHIGCHAFAWIFALAFLW